MEESSKVLEKMTAGYVKKWTNFRKLLLLLLFVLNLCKVSTFTCLTKPCFFKAYSFDTNLWLQFMVYLMVFTLALFQVRAQCQMWLYYYYYYYYYNNISFFGIKGSSLSQNSPWEANTIRLAIKRQILSVCGSTLCLLT
jgi:hypothetical protein